VLEIIEYLKPENISDKILKPLKHFTGELSPYIANPKDKRRMFANEFAESDQKILEHIKKAKKALVIEDHYEFGGIGTRINELVSSHQLNIPVVKDSVIGIPSGSIGDFAYMERKLMKEVKVVVRLLIK
jgi:hypothetical protein